MSRKERVGKQDYEVVGYGEYEIWTYQARGRWEWRISKIVRPNGSVVDNDTAVKWGYKIPHPEYGHISVDVGNNPYHAAHSVYEHLNQEMYGGPGPDDIAHLYFFIVWKWNGEEHVEHGHAVWACSIEVAEETLLDSINDFDQFVIERGEMLK